MRWKRQFALGRKVLRGTPIAATEPGSIGLLPNLAQGTPGMWPQKFFRLVKQAAVAWNDDNATTLGAAIAYYTVFSLAPLLLIAISMASMLVGEEQARSGIGDQIRHTLGPVTADAITAMLNNSQRTGGKIGVTLLGGAALLIGASGAFVQLQEALNLIWKTAAQPRRGSFLVYFLRNRLLSFAAVLGTGFLLLVSLIVSTLLAAAEHCCLL
jgi:membrane protein